MDPADDSSEQICRVCRIEGSSSKPLYHPCICTGTIKYIHEDCLVKWLRISKKETCELCKHRFKFIPVYAPDMPNWLPVSDIALGLTRSVRDVFKYWLHYSLVSFCWLIVVPLTACRIYRSLFLPTVHSVLRLPLDLISTDNVLGDCLYGAIIVAITLVAFISLAWLRDTILGHWPDWLDLTEPAAAARAEAPVPEVAQLAAANGGGGDGGGDDGAPEHEQPARPDALVRNDDNLVDNLPDEPDDEDDDTDADDADDAAADAWNPLDWQPPEELTWQRMFGFDGSLVFLEHVFWVISLNSLFVLLFAFCPYYVGQLFLTITHLNAFVQQTNFHGVSAVFVGYFWIAALLYTVYVAADVLRFYRPRKYFAIAYLMVKVGLLFFIELGLFPLYCGLCLDVCSLKLFGASWPERQASLARGAGSFAFVHWLVGMVFIFYFANFVLLLREVVRPGLLWFLRNINDPEFNPVFDMMNLSAMLHVRRLCTAVLFFGVLILLVVYLPTLVAAKLVTDLVPYHIYWKTASMSNEWVYIMVSLNIMIPQILEISFFKDWLKAVGYGWLCFVSWLMPDMEGFLLGRGQGATPAPGSAEERDGRQAVVPNDVAQINHLPAPLFDNQNNLAAQHHALTEAVAPNNMQPYVKPRLFALKVCIVLLLLMATLVAAGVVALSVPALTGRRLLRLLAAFQVEQRLHEMYTIAAGVSFWWLVAAGATAAASKLSEHVRRQQERDRAAVVAAAPLEPPRGLLSSGLEALRDRYVRLIAAVSAVVRRDVDTKYCRQVAKCLFVLFFLTGVAPLLMGLLFENVILIPLRSPLHSTPLHFYWLDFCYGFLLIKLLIIVFCSRQLAPALRLRNDLMQLVEHDVEHAPFELIVRAVMPIVCALTLSLTLPYLYTHQLLVSLGASDSLRREIWRSIYPFLVLAGGLCWLFRVQLGNFVKLYQKIRNDRYLVGRRLVNYEHQYRTRHAGGAR